MPPGATTQEAWPTALLETLRAQEVCWYVTETDEDAELLAQVDFPALPVPFAKLSALTLPLLKDVRALHVFQREIDPPTFSELVQRQLHAIGWRRRLYVSTLPDPFPTLADWLKAIGGNMDLFARDVLALVSAGKEVRIRQAKATSPKPNASPQVPTDPRTLSGLEQATSPLIWVGSAEDRKLIIEAGYPDCVAVPEIPPMGRNDRKALAYLQPLEAQLLAIAQHTFLLPNTAEGRALQAELIRRIGVERCWTVAWPSECETIQHILEEGHEGLLAETLTNAKPAPITGVIRVEDLRQQLYDWWHHGSPQGVSTGWTPLDRIYRVLPGEFTLITGVPSSGKSSWVSALLVNLAREHDWAFTVFSPEMAPPARYLRLMLRQLVGKPFDEGQTPRMSWQQAEEGIAWLNQHITFLWPQEHIPSIPHLLELAKTQVFRHGIKGMVIDPWNRVSHDRRPGISETEYIGQALSMLQQFGQVAGVHIWLIAHPFKIFKDDSGRYPVVTPNQVSGSSNFWNQPDNILSVWRDFTPGNREVQIHVQKSRFDESGQMGKAIALTYHPASARYSERTGGGE